MIFTTSEFVNSSRATGSRHGRTWTGEELHKPKELFLQGRDITFIMPAMGRSAVAVTSKLEAMGLIERDRYGDFHVVEPCTSFTGYPGSGEVTIHLGNTNQTTEENTMNHDEKQPSATIEEITLIQGQNAARMSDDQIFSLIAKLEAEAERLSKIQAKPKKLGLKIQGIHEDIAKLVEYVDGRESA